MGTCLSATMFLLLFVRHSVFASLNAKTQQRTRRWSGAEPLNSKEGYYENWCKTQNWARRREEGLLPMLERLLNPSPPRVNVPKQHRCTCGGLCVRRCSPTDNCYTRELKRIAEGKAAGSRKGTSKLR